MRRSRVPPLLLFACVAACSQQFQVGSNAVDGGGGNDATHTSDATPMCTGGAIECAGGCAPCPTEGVASVGCSGNACAATACIPGFERAGNACVRLSRWVTERVTTTGIGFSTMSTDRTSIAISAADRVLIAFKDFDSTSASYREFDAPGAYSGGPIEDRSTDLGSGIAFGFDTAGTPHASYVELGTDSLRHATPGDIGSSSVWDTEALDFGVSANTAIAFGPGDLVHIAYFSADGFPRYARQESGVWITSVVENARANVERGLTIAVNPTTNLPSIVYTYASGDSVNCARADGEGAWLPELVDAQVGRSPGWYPSLAFSSDGQGHLSYYEPTFGELVYRTRDSEWRGGGVVDSVGDVGEFTSIAVGADDRPSISYRDHTNNALKYAHFNGTAWELEVVSSEFGTGRLTSLAFDSLGIPHISHYNSVTTFVSHSYVVE